MFSNTSLEARANVSELTLRHELDIMDVKAATRSPEKKLFDDENHIVPGTPFFQFRISGTLVGVKMESGWHFEPGDSRIIQ